MYDVVGCKSVRLSILKVKVLFYNSLKQ